MFDLQSMFRYIVTTTRIGR